MTKPEVSAATAIMQEPDTITHRARFEDHPKIVPNVLSRYTVCLDRSEKPPYPDWVRAKNGLTHPRLERTGLTQYDIQTQVGEFVHEKIQKEGSVDTRFIYNCLENTEFLVSCLNLQDAIAMKRKGLAVFRKFFAGKIPLFFGTVVQHRNNDKLYVACLLEEDGKLKDDFFPLDHKCLSTNPVLYFK